MGRSVHDFLESSLGTCAEVNTLYQYQYSPVISTSVGSVRHPEFLLQKIEKMQDI